MKTTLKAEVIKTLQFMVDTDKEIYGAISYETEKAIKAQGAKIVNGKVR